MAELPNTITKKDNYWIRLLVDSSPGLPLWKTHDLLHVVIMNNVKTGNFVIISNNAKIYYVSLCNVIGAVFWHGNRYFNMFMRYCFLLNWFKCDALFICITCTIIIKLRNTYSLGRGWCLTHETQSVMFMPSIYIVIFHLKSAST